MGKNHVDMNYQTAQHACAINVVSLNVFRSVCDLTRWTDLSLRAAIISAICVKRGLGGRITHQGKRSFYPYPHLGTGELIQSLV